MHSTLIIHLFVAICHASGLRVWARERSRSNERCQQLWPISSTISDFKTETWSCPRSGVHKPAQKFKPRKGWADMGGSAQCSACSHMVVMRHVWHAPCLSQVPCIIPAVRHFVQKFQLLSSEDWLEKIQSHSMSQHLSTIPLVSLIPHQAKCSLMIFDVSQNHGFKFQVVSLFSFFSDILIILTLN